MLGFTIVALLAVAWAAQDTLPAGKGRETLENTCTECHGLDQVLERLRTTEQWRTVTAQMRARGATMSDDEMKTLVEYLSQNFGVVEKINVNKATAAELEKLTLKPADAAAIVRYREAKGPYKEWKDLLKVEGVDAARIEAVKDRLVF